MTQPSGTGAHRRTTEILPPPSGTFNKRRSLKGGSFKEEVWAAARPRRFRESDDKSGKLCQSFRAAENFCGEKMNLQHRARSGSSADSVHSARRFSENKAKPKTIGSVQRD